MIREYESDELNEDSEEDRTLLSAETRALDKIREKKWKNAFNRSTLQLPA